MGSSRLPTLPGEIVLLIGESLLADRAHRSLLNLAHCNHSFKSLLTSTLYSSSGGKAALRHAAERGELRKVEELIKDYKVTVEDSAALHAAAAANRVEVLELLLKNGGNVEAQDERGRRPLHEAAEKGYVEAVKILLSKGADVDARDEKGMTPLHCACAQGC